jgi:5-methyltetrahydrofolate--homocysteine methyltransferase
MQDFRMLLENTIRLQKQMRDLIEEYLKQNVVNIIGGCCGTTPEHIRLIAEARQKIQS